MEFVLESVRIGFGALSHSELQALEGWLLAGLHDHPLPGLFAEALDASDADYVLAQDALSVLEAAMFRPMVGRNFIDSPYWPTLTLGAILVARHLEKSLGDEFTVANILANIPHREGFERLAKDLTGVLLQRLPSERR